MAAVFTRVPFPVSGPDQSRIVTDMTADASYPAGGYAVLPRDLGLITIKDISGNLVALNGPIDCAVKGGAASGLTAQFDYTTSGSRVSAGSSSTSAARPTLF